MKLFHYGKDGGPDSTVWGFWLIEWKRVFSIALLCFEDGSREAYHSHAFNSISWVLSGNLVETEIHPRTGLPLIRLQNNGSEKGPLYHYPPSFLPVFTARDRMHKVTSVGRTWVLTFRGPWSKTWKEYLPISNEYVTLTHGRRKI